MGRPLDGNGWTGSGLLLLLEEGQTGGVLHLHQGSLEEEAKLALEAIGLQERKALEQFYPAVRKSTPQVRVLAERYGGDVSFSFDSNGRSVWVMALFGKDAPPTLRTVSDGEVPWIPLDEKQGEDCRPLPFETALRASSG